MFPAFSLARELQSRGHKVVMITDARGEKYKAQYPDIPFHIVRAETVRRGLISKLKLLADLAVGTGQAFLLLKKLKPRAVVGFGGYPSFPAVSAAQGLRIPTLIHEQNAVLGKANQLVAGGAKMIALGLPELGTIPARWKDKTIITGNPVRAEIEGISHYAPPESIFRILVLGGSQGASVFSKTVPEAIALLPEGQRRRLSIVQQCRAADLAGCKHAYDLLGVSARLETFITDVPAQLAFCHVLIARSGASTVAETAVAGRPAIFVPYPHHKDQQQKVNAMTLAKAGGAIVLDEKTLTPADLAKELEGLMENPAYLASMAEAARKSAIREASKRLADAVMAL
jgi:UDP-N-acetylglucosamine--N-acetylmuramyl-(pentapeptide) pyrophosphoryl-undecaprenol N-acetylglucosamine transferase